MINKDIKNVYFRNNGTSALYCGSTLIWKKEKEEPLTGFLRGKFTDDSTEEDWWYYINGLANSNNKVSIAEYVNPETKEFEVALGNKITTLMSLFIRNEALEYIYELPYNENITSVWTCFGYCTSLKSINLNGWDNLSPSTSLGCFFGNSGIEQIDLTKLDTSHTDSLSMLFNSCSNLKHLNVSSFVTENVTDFMQMFCNCTNLVSLIGTENFNINKAVYIDNMFSGCRMLESLNLTNWDFSNLNIQPFNVFGNCLSLTNIIGPIYNIRFDVEVKDSPLTNESAMVFINGLSEDIQETKTITFNSNTYDTLTEEQIAMATSKGWSVVRSK